MSPDRRGIPAKKVARDFGGSLTTYVEEVTALVGQLDDAASPLSPQDRCFETCAALWATIVISMESSALRNDERAALEPIVFSMLEPFWGKYCGTERAAFGRLRTRAQQYLALKHPRSHVNTGAAITTQLFRTLQLDERAHQVLARRIAALLAHRMLGDIHRLNEVKVQFGIQLSLLAVTLTGCLASGGEVVLRALRVI
jgi:hypothetical protein